MEHGNWEIGQPRNRRDGPKQMRLRRGGKSTYFNNKRRGRESVWFIQSILPPKNKPTIISVSFPRLPLLSSSLYLGSVGWQPMSCLVQQQQQKPPLATPSSLQAPGQTSWGIDPPPVGNAQQEKKSLLENRPGAGSNLGGPDVLGGWQSAHPTDRTRDPPRWADAAAAHTP